MRIRKIKFKGSRVLYHFLEAQLSLSYFSKISLRNGIIGNYLDDIGIVVFPIPEKEKIVNSLIREQSFYTQAY